MYDELVALKDRLTTDTDTEEIKLVHQVLSATLDLLITANAPVPPPTE